MRPAAQWRELASYGALIPVVLLVARKTRRALRRRPVARVVALYAVPALVVIRFATGLVNPASWRWVDPRLFDAGTEIVMFGGLAVAFIALLRADRQAPEFAGQVVLALGAHPDDIELGCAGFLLKLKASGARTYGLTFTHGERGTDRNGDREVEARTAATFLGLDAYWILDFPDTGLHDRVSEVRALIEDKVKELGVTMLLTHTDVDVHGDHRAVFVAMREAARTVPTVLSYEDVSTPSQFTPNFYVDVSNYIDDHLRACAYHRTQHDRTYMDPQVIQGRAAHRGMQIGVQFAIAYRSLTLIR
jgi:LmbE family N-acetylglucosaminyl deacetylase